MRGLTDASKVRQLLKLLGRRARGSGRIYLTGGATAVLLGWRLTTKDVDLKLAPEPPGVFEAIRDAKEELGINIELAAPDDFIPPVPGWEDRSIFISREGAIDVYHYDPLGQALAKIERGHRQDLDDVRALASLGLVGADRLLVAFEQIRGAPCLRYPAIDPDVFRQKVERAAAELRTRGGEGGGS